MLTTIGVMIFAFFFFLRLPIFQKGSPHVGGQAVFVDTRSISYILFVSKFKWVTTLVASFGFSLLNWGIFYQLFWNDTVRSWSLELHLVHSLRSLQGGGPWKHSLTIRISVGPVFGIPCCNDAASIWSMRHLAIVVIVWRARISPGHPLPHRAF